MKLYNICIWLILLHVSSEFILWCVSHFKIKNFFSQSDFNCALCFIVAETVWHSFKPPENLKVNGGHRTLFADAETEILKAYIGLQGVHGVHIRRQTLGLWVYLFSIWITRWKAYWWQEVNINQHFILF